MTKQFETKVTLVSGRNPGISRAVGQPEEEATVLPWPGSPGASLVTGHAQPVDGGRLI
jgi:hypothetical protein